MRHLVGLLLLTVLAGCGVTPPGPSPTSGSPTPALGPSASPAPVPSAPSPSAPSPPPTVPPSPSPTPLPNPGGTCSASQFVLGTARSGYTYSAALWRHAILEQPLRNAAGACVLNVPTMIGVASATGPFQAVRVNNVGYEVCVNSACHYVSPPSYKIRSGQSLTIGFDTSWWVGANDANGMPLYTATPCPGAVRDVTRVEFPLASGAVMIDLGTVWREVCASPVSVSITVEN